MEKVEHLKQKEMSKYDIETQVLGLKDMSVEAHDGGQTSKEDSESVQETSSEQSDA